MSLLLKSKDILFQDIVKKTIDPKSFLGKKLKRISLKEVEQYLKEQAFLKNFLKALSNEELFSDSEETSSETSQSLKPKIQLVKKLLGIKHISILAITYSPKVIKPIFIDNKHQEKSFQIILDSKTANKIKSMDNESAKMTTLLREKIEPLVEEDEKLLNIKLIRYQKNLDVILLYQTNFPAFLSKKLDDSIVILLKKVIEKQALLASSDSFAKAQKSERKEALHNGLKDLFLHQKKEYFDKTIKTIMDTFSLKTLLLLECIDSENEIYRMSNFYGNGKYVKEDIQLDILDILSIHTDESLRSKIFSNVSKALPAGKAIFQALFLNGPEIVVIPIAETDGENILEKTDNLKNLRALLEHLFLSEESLK